MLNYFEPCLVFGTRKCIIVVYVAETLLDFKLPSFQEEDKAGVSSLDNEAPNDSSAGVHKKEKAPVQPTATQIMLSQLIGGEQKNMDEVQRNKIQQVIKKRGIVGQRGGRFV